MDVHVPRAITHGLRLRGVDVLTSQEDGTRERSDPELLDRATALYRLLFTRDEDLLREASQRQERGETFAGVVYAHQLRVSIGQCVQESQTEDMSKNTEGMSPKEKWFKAYAVQQLGINPDLTYAKLRYHVVFSTVQRAKLFSHQVSDQIDSVFHQAKFPFENTRVHLLWRGHRLTDAGLRVAASAPGIASHSRRWPARSPTIPHLSQETLNHFYLSLNLTFCSKLLRLRHQLIS
jgi:hypothetical protein